MAFEIPEGYVAIPRQYSNDRNQARELLAAADELGVDQAEAVVTTSEGYHVKQEVAEKWAEQYDFNLDSDDDEVEETRDYDDEGRLILGNEGLAGGILTGDASGEPQGERVPAETEDEPEDSGSGEESQTPGGEEDSTKQPAGSQVSPDGGESEVKLETVSFPTESNTVKEIEEWAGKYAPDVDLSGAANKGERIKLLTDSIPDAILEDADGNRVNADGTPYTAPAAE